MGENERSRKFNWHPDEVALLEELYEKYAAILDSKSKDNGTNQKKNKVLDRIESVLKKTFPEYGRKVDGIKEKLKNMKRRGHTLPNNEKAENTQVGGEKFSINRKITPEKMAVVNRSTPDFSAGIIDILSPTGSVHISPTPPPLFGTQPSTSHCRKSPRIYQCNLLKRKQPSPACSPKKSRKVIARSPKKLEKKVAEMKSSTALLDQQDYFKQLQIEVLELEKQRLHLDIEKIRAETELLKTKKEYLDRKLEKL